MHTPHSEDFPAPIALYLATGNAGKLRDFRAMGGAFTAELLPEFARLPAAVEDGATFSANARKKAEHYSRFHPGWVLSDDSGLEVDALGGEPGVRSARYAGAQADDEANNRLLLERLRNVPRERRGGRFVCVLALARNGRAVAEFAGRAEGVILAAPRGKGGFGYDPLFYSPEAGCGFAELTAEQKAAFSHRGRAVRQFLSWARTEGRALLES